MFFSLSIFGQTKRVVISKLEITNLTCEHVKLVNLDKNDTIYYISISFKNLKYSSISDYKYIYIYSRAELEIFVKDLTSALSEMGIKQNMSWDREEYSIVLNESTTKLLYLFADSPRGLISLSKKEVEKILNWVNSVKYGEG